MAEKLRIFVSATKDLDGERAMIGRALAELPVEIGAEIRRTPSDGASYDDIFELIANVDRLYFLMGSDITAPSGAEWQVAWKLERAILPLRKPARLTPAAQDFLRPSFVEWTWFRSRRELWQIVTQDLVRILNHPKNRYGLSVTELELLNLHGKRLRPRSAAHVQEPGGAEGGGVLLDIGHDVFDEDLLLEE
jgi:hypothetical protein